MKKILIIGSSGSIGHALFNFVKIEKNKVIGTYFNKKSDGLVKFDLLNNEIKSVVPELNKEWLVFFLSAKTSPNWVFENNDLSNQINRIATKKLIDDVLASGAHLTVVSSSMVFDGQTGNYSERDKTNPLNLYGQQKLDVEKHIGINNKKALIIRTDSIITPRIKDNCPVEKLYQTLYAGNAKMAFDNVISMIDVEELSEVIWRLASTRRSGIFHVGADKAYSRVELANWIVDESSFGEQMTYEEVPFSSIHFPEKRPLRSFLNNSKVKKLLGYQFTETESLVRNKVRLIDNHVNQFGPYWETLSN